MQMSGVGRSRCVTSHSGGLGFVAIRYDLKSDNDKDAIAHVTYVGILSRRQVVPLAEGRPILLRRKHLFTTTPQPLAKFSQRVTIHHILVIIDVLLKQCSQVARPAARPFTGHKLPKSGRY